MAIFLWEGKTAQGRVLKGEIEAPNLEAVFAILRDRRIRPIPNRIREKGRGLDTEIKYPRLWRKAQGPRPFCIHSPVRYDDRRRPTYRTMLGYSD